MAGAQLVVGARRRQGELEHQCVADQLLEVDLVALDRVGLVVLERVALEQLGHADDEVGGELAQAGAALAFPAGVELAPGHDAVGHAFQHEVEADGLDDAGDRGAERRRPPPPGAGDGARQGG